MNEFVTRTRRDKRKEQRHCNVKKRVLAIIEMILITSLLVAAVYFFLDKTKAKATMKEHTIQKGETLFSISNQYHIDIEDIQRINKLESNKIEKGRSSLFQNKIHPPIMWLKRVRRSIP
ncbi:LysM peptidoglycan-binding domain-containing protein [Neobacillus sp. D3-1R]|uniref:LysM peptidoglycan-binding domain-containing protein n=1 Tax=Neobacillus sp. D3-1R TaxID=3445778 RepID=UPI003F9FAD7E